MVQGADRSRDRGRRDRVLPGARAKYDYPPDMEDAAVELVLEQAEQYALAA